MKSKALEQLHQLAKPGGHLWPPGAVDSIVDIASDTKQPRVLSLALGESDIQTLTGTNPSTGKIANI